MLSNTHFSLGLFKKVFWRATLPLLILIKILAIEIHLSALANFCRHCSCCLTSGLSLCEVSAVILLFDKRGLLVMHYHVRNFYYGQRMEIAVGTLSIAL